MTGAQPLLQAVGLHKAYGQNAALHGAEFHIRTGEVVAVRSGAARKRRTGWALEPLQRFRTVRGR